MDRPPLISWTESEQNHNKKDRNYFIIFRSFFVFQTSKHYRKKRCWWIESISWWIESIIGRKNLMGWNFTSICFCGRFRSRSARSLCFWDMEGSMFSESEENHAFRSCKGGYRGTDLFRWILTGIASCLRRQFSMPAAPAFDEKGKISEMLHL